MIFLKSSTLYTRQKKIKFTVYISKLPSWLTIVSWNTFSCLPWWRCFGVTQSNTWRCYWGSSLWGERHGLLGHFSIELHFFSTCAVSLILDLFTYPYTNNKNQRTTKYIIKKGKQQYLVHSVLKLDDIFRVIHMVHFF